MVEQLDVVEDTGHSLCAGQRYVLMRKALFAKLSQYILSKTPVQTVSVPGIGPP
jgi:hypothetical protein